MAKIIVRPANFPTNVGGLEFITGQYAVNDDPFYSYVPETSEFEDREMQVINNDYLNQIAETAQTLSIPSPSQLSKNKIVHEPQLTKNQTTEVTSIYDGRPINGTDFFKSGGTIAFTTTALLNDTETGNFTYIIPNGFVAVLRGFRWQYDPVYLDSTISSMITYLAVDGQRIVHYDAINDLQFVEERIPNFLILTEGQTLEIVSIRISNVALAARALPANPTYFADFYGNVLQSRNLPSNFEVGSYK